MKRSSSKKDGLQKPEDGSQQKISSFFKAGPVPQQSKLFSNVSKSKPPLSLKRHNSGTSKPISTTSTKTGQKAHCDSTKSTMTVLKEFNSTTHVQATPPKSGIRQLSELESPELLIIPDTPEDKLNKPLPKLASRSFLCPISQLSTMPGKRASPPKPKQRKVVKKTLGTVSVEFGPQKMNEDEKAKLKTAEDSVVKCDDGPTSLARTETLVKTSSNSGTGRDGVVSDDIDFADFDFESGALSDSGDFVKLQSDKTVSPTSKQIPTQSITPTKCCNDRNTVKRMAVPGLSPVPKRFIDTESVTTHSTETSEITSSQRKIKAKRQLASLAGFKDVKEMNHSMNKYQLGGSTKVKDKDKDSISSNNDEVLTDILGQMADTGPMKDLPEKKKSKEKEKKVCSVEPDVSLRTEKEPLFDTSEDDVLKEILGELGDGMLENQATNSKQCRLDASKQASDSATSRTARNTKEVVKSNNLLRKKVREETSFAGSCRQKDQHRDNSDTFHTEKHVSDLKLCLSTGSDSIHVKSSSIKVETTSMPSEQYASSSMQVEHSSMEIQPSRRQSETLSMQAESSSMQTETTSMQTESSRMQTETIRMQTESDSIQTETTSMQAESSSMQTEASSMQTETSSKQVEGISMPVTCSSMQGAGIPHKSRSHVKVAVEDTVDRELAGSFGHLSPFKRKTLESCSARQPGPSEGSVKFTDKWNRYTVHSVNIDRKSHEKMLCLSKEGNPEVVRTARLSGFWSDTHIEEGDIVHLLLDDDSQDCSDDDRVHKDAVEDRPIVIDDNQGQIIVNPDLLLSGTTIVSGLYCLRRSVLNEKFKGMDSKNVHMLYGSIIHSLFQQVLKDRLTKKEEIIAVAKSIVQSNKFLHEMYGQSVTEARVMEEIEVYIPPLQAWLNKHVPSTSDSQRHRNKGDVHVVQIHDIEETIWSPRIGVKGKIDMTVEVEMGAVAGVERKIVPLELKTGKASYSVEHKGQVTLYSMMMADRRQSPGEGLLLYLKHNDMNSIPVRPENTRGLLQLRNEMAYYLSRQVTSGRDDEGHVTHQLGRLPEPINSLRSCSKCPQLINCALYQREVEKTEHTGDHAMKALIPDTLSHLSDAHLNYFTHWLLCLDLETAVQRREGLRNIWCMASSQREERGECIQHVVMVNTVLGVPETQAFTEGKGCCVQFQRKPGFEGGPLNTAGLSKNDAVVLSSEDGRYIALSTGFIKNITDSIVDVVVDRDSFHENAAFQSLVFRIDRCDIFNTAGYLLTNLSRLMEPSPHCQKLRSLIVECRKPEFNLTMSKTAVEKVKKIFRPLNKPQKTAILKVLMCKDYVLIKGYPGTGKTSTIVALVKILRELGQSVLLTSYTHSAVDNILLKLKQDGVPFLRLGRSSRIHPLIQDHAAERLALDVSSVDGLKDFYASYSVVATSCLGLNHAIFTQRRFDVCIVDEASQVLQPACVGPLFHSDRFVLVGDALQLPPVVQSKEASSLGMGESLFARLDGKGATYDLHLQYRMNSTIMQLSNELVYKGALKCGNDVVSQACIQPLTTLKKNGKEWLERALDSSLTNAVVFLDTRQISAPESTDSRGIVNDTEGRLVMRLCTTFVQAGISADDIGVIAPYRAQVRSLQQRSSECFPLRGVEVNTVDQYQGRDKSVIVISFVRSSPSGSSESSQRGGLLQDVRRLNVAVTRAKHKLVMVGNTSTLSHYSPVADLLIQLHSRHQVFVLPPDLQLQCNVD